MRPEIVLAGDFSYSEDYVKKMFEEWVSSYKIVAEEHPLAEEMAKRLIKRAELAFKIYMDRKKNRGHCEDFALECSNECALEDASLDGDFLLGNEEDAVFVHHFFSVLDMAKMQLGYAYEVEYSIEKDEKIENIKCGFFDELARRWKRAELCYSSAVEDLSDPAEKDCILKRIEFCKKQAVVRGTELYEKGATLVKKMNYKEAWPLLYEAARLDYHLDALAEIAHMEAYGLDTFVDRDLAVDELRYCADNGCNYACSILWKMHDDGFLEVPAAEAKKWCEVAAKRGDNNAIARLGEGFDPRPVTEILMEKAEAGNKDALWYLANEYRSIGEEAKSKEYFKKALQVGQLDAVLTMAEHYADSTNCESYDVEKAEEYYRKAADQGSERAMLALGNLALKDTNVEFWNQNTENIEVPISLKEQHEEQFAWYLLAAENGCIEVMEYIANAYYYGYPVKKDDEQAFMWVSRAVEAGPSYPGYSSSAHILAYFYENGYGCVRNMEEAVRLYTVAEKGGQYYAMYRLYDIYRYGTTDVPADQEKANYYRCKARIENE